MAAAERAAFRVGHKTTHLVLGSLGAVAGSVAATAALVELFHGGEQLLAAPGLVLGAACGLPCLLGWRAACVHSRALIMACLVWSILAAVFAFLGLITFSVERVDPGPSSDLRWSATVRAIAARAGLSACAVEIFVASVHAGVAFVSYGQLCAPRGADRPPALIPAADKAQAPPPDAAPPRRAHKMVQAAPPSPLIETTPRLRCPTPSLPPMAPPRPGPPPYEQAVHLLSRRERQGRTWR